MNVLRVEEREEAGFRALWVTNGPLALTVVPELGGKIAVQEDRRRGVSWLWRNPYLPWRRPFPGASYVAAFDLGGWDECFPSVAPGVYPAAPWDGMPLPDHGELWSQPWAMEAQIEGERLLVRGRVEGHILPYRFERLLMMEADRPSVHLRYRVENRSEHTLYFLWAAHPLFPLEPGTRLLLPGPATGRVAAAVGFSPAAMAFEWPRLPAEGGWVDLQGPDPAGGWAVKVFLQPAAAWARLVRPEGAWWEVRWQGPVTHLGLWINAGGWSGAGTPPYRNLALEPGIGAPDDLTAAMQECGSFGVLPPLREAEWSLTVTVG